MVMQPNLFHSDRATPTGPRRTRRASRAQIGRRTLRIATAAVVLLATLAATGTMSASGEVSRFAFQHVSWTDCPTDDLRTAGAQCAEISVPLDYSAPEGPTITIAVSRIKARDTEHRRGILLFNPGGPGGPGLSYPVELRPALADVADRYDLIGFDPRFVGLSTPINCGGIGEYVRAAGLSWRDYIESVRFAADIAGRCWRKAAGLVPHASTRNTARDMDLIRAVLGEPKLSYLGVSYGTYLGAVYTQMFPRRTDRMVLDSAVDPSTYPVRADWSTGPAAELALDGWAAWAAEHHDRFGLGSTSAEVRTTVHGLLNRAAHTPIRVGEYTVDEQVIPLLIAFYLADTGSDETLATIVSDLRAAADGRPVTNPDLAADLAVLYGEDGADDGAALSITCADGNFPRNPLWYWRNIERSRSSQPIFGPLARNISPCAFWQSRSLEGPTAVGNKTPALIVHATGDVWTPYSDALALHDRLTGSRLVTLDGVRAHGVFGSVPNACVERHVNTYLRDGVRPPTNVTCQPDSE
jgi:pimeloyl-ACP methyl ester carboxylesterase